LSPKQKKTLDDIKKWLHEYNIFVFKEIENEDNAFTLETTLKLKPKVLPFYIIGSKQTDEKIILSWFWGFAPEDTNTLRLIDMNLKQKFASDVKYGFGLLNLPLKI
jgi:hypothetical protein